MKEKEYIQANVDVVKGKTVCVCLASDKRCEKECDVCTLTRDRYEGWLKTLKQDKYGK